MAKKIQFNALKTCTSVLSCKYTDQKQFMFFWDMTKRGPLLYGVPYGVPKME